MKKFYSMIAVAVAFLSSIGCKAQVNNVKVDEFAAAVDAGERIVDVRTAEEFADGFIPGACNIDWRQDGFLEKVEKQFDNSRPLYVYCRSGRRSAEAAKALYSAGYEVYNLLGGFIAWNQAEKPVNYR